MSAIRPVFISLSSNAAPWTKNNHKSRKQRKTEKVFTCDKINTTYRYFKLTEKKLKGKIHFIYAPHFHYVFISQGTSRMVPFPL